VSVGIAMIPPVFKTANALEISELAGRLVSEKMASANNREIGRSGVG
jgi:hypothetical protein